MLDLSHLDALRLRLSHERERLARATSESECNARRAYVAQCEREIAGELAFLGLPADECAAPMSDDELLAALSG